MLGRRTRRVRLREGPMRKVKMPLQLLPRPNGNVLTSRFNQARIRMFDLR